MSKFFARWFDVAVQKHWLAQINKVMDKANYHANQYTKNREILGTLINEYNKLYDRNLGVGKTNGHQTD